MLGRFCCRAENGGFGCSRPATGQDCAYGSWATEVIGCQGCTEVLVRPELDGARVLSDDLENANAREHAPLGVLLGLVEVHWALFPRAWLSVLRLKAGLGGLERGGPVRREKDPFDGLWLV